MHLCRLDYCNALLYGVADGLYQCTFVYTPYRTPRRALYPGYNISVQPFYVSIGCLYDSQYCSRSLYWSSSV